MRGHCFTSTFIRMAGGGDGSHLVREGGRAEEALVLGRGGGEGRVVPVGSTPDSWQPGLQKRQDLERVLLLLSPLPLVV
jgi:hypothetical protein